MMKSAHAICKRYLFWFVAAEGVLPGGGHAEGAGLLFSNSRMLQEVIHSRVVSRSNWLFVSGDGGGAISVGLEADHEDESMLRLYKLIESGLLLTSPDDDIDSEIDDIAEEVEEAKTSPE
ncbi:MAG: hypothetical protein ACR2PT_14510 [Endozoicomonas sp.]